MYHIWLDPYQIPGTQTEGKHVDFVLDIVFPLPFLGQPTCLSSRDDHANAYISIGMLVLHGTYGSLKPLSIMIVVNCNRATTVYIAVSLEVCPWQEGSNSNLIQYVYELQYIDICEAYEYTAVRVNTPKTKLQSRLAANGRKLILPASHMVHVVSVFFLIFFSSKRVTQLGDSAYFYRGNSHE